LRLSHHSRNPQFSQSVDYTYEYEIQCMHQNLRYAVEIWNWSDFWIRR
jgi:hypothetical protein